ncbi:insulin-like growth factor 1 [Pseudochaenichthys georgianus]|uniref:insulin-like growth factor 1 n=1 Tax=Pseudochaenichthys georgianus TaxID=52239 RepID=UPI0039C0674F
MCICLAGWPLASEAGWPLASEAGRLRCGSDLLKDLMFVCGDRGIYLGRGSWSGYGGRPRGKGIVEQCCRSPGCGLQYLETYCNKPKGQQPTTAPPATTTAPPATTTAPPATTTAPPATSTAPPTTTTEPSTTTPTDMAQQLQAVFQRRLSEHLGAANSATKKKTSPPPPRRKSKSVSSRRRKKRSSTTSRPSSTSRSPPQSTTALKS